MRESFTPTRMELIETKNRIRLARKGHKLLKQKRDFLVMEFLTILGQTKLLRKNLNTRLKAAWGSLARAEASHSIFELENSAMLTREVEGVTVDERNVMGVRLPKMKKHFGPRSVGKRGYSIIGSSAKIDAVSTDFQEALDVILDIAESEISVRKLVREIEKTKRRVNALEYNIIPSLLSRKKEIEFRLDEMERESLVTLKSLKTVFEAEGGVY